MHDLVVGPTVDLPQAVYRRMRNKEVTCGICVFTVNLRVEFIRCVALTDSNYGFKGAMTVRNKVNLSIRGETHIFPIKFRLLRKESSDDAGLRGGVMVEYLHTFGSQVIARFPSEWTARISLMCNMITSVSDIY